MKIDRLDDSHAADMIALRRDFHQYPELGFKEFRTQQKIISCLDETGIQAKKIAGTGVAGVLSGNLPGRTILLRSDMDALPVHEETGLDFSSENPGIMHACGHDGHMAMLLTAAKLLAERKKQIPGSIVFAFQPNEEDAGAWKMIEDGVLENPQIDAAFGCHLWSGIKSGTIDICDGPVMAASHYFKVRIEGSGGHAGFAHESVDPIFTASQVIQAVQAIQTRQMNALHPAAIIFTRIQGGTNPTIIPENVTLEGSIRFLYNGGEKILKKFKRIVEKICQLNMADCDIKFKVGNHMLSNDNALADMARKTASEITRDNAQVTSNMRTMAGEDFSEFATRVPSVFAFVGADNGSDKTCFPHHHPRFDIDEDAMITGTLLFAQIALNYLQETR